MIATTGGIFFYGLGSFGVPGWRHGKWPRACGSGWGGGAERFLHRQHVAVRVWSLALGRVMLAVTACRYRTHLDLSL